MRNITDTCYVQAGVACAKYHGHMLYVQAGVACAKYHGHMLYVQAGITLNYYLLILRPARVVI
ncbi:hypothetical protein FACS1894132_11000 [Clostridia bacterium]|nr:hypothetical protein FACS1894132_11000 [Clostridia bacterium]